MSDLALSSAAAPVSVARRAVAAWLFACAGLVAFMVVVGGLTRLTESGLSMTEWRPVTGWLPPLSEAEWQRVFDLYRTSPEYRIVNAGMSLAAFRDIFWLEYLHRLLGRIIGLAYALPLAWFWLRGCLPAGSKLPLLGLLCLGAGQGLMGWLMVQSGLEADPRVSHFKLAAHLMLAFVILAGLLAMAIRIAGIRAADPAMQPGKAGWALLGLVSVTVLYGAFVAGLDAGLSFNSFPLMAGRLVPEGIWALSPGWENPLFNSITIQFAHRWLGLATAALALWLGIRLWYRHVLPRVLVAVTLCQVALGIATLLLYVPISLAVLHQLGAVCLFATTVTMLAIRPAPSA